MKNKIWATIVIGVVLLMSMSSIVYASETYETEPVLVESVPEYEEEQLLESPEVNDQTIMTKRQRLQKRYMNGELPTDAAPARIQKYKPYMNTKIKARFKGVWGYTDSEEIEGYVGGVIGRRGRVGFLKGVWNTTDGETKWRVVGILKHGFFNGRVINEDGEKTPITGFYKVNRENNTFGIKWMTPHKSGFVRAKYSPIRLGITKDVDVEEQNLI
jgi:hypothetical protein